MKRPRLKHAYSLLYVILFTVLAFLFFTNDFGLLDLRKTSVVIGIGLDIEDEEVVLTAQLAVPQPAENGENTKFNVVTGNGITVADALIDVNVKTGFYPKLEFCKLIVLGESCFKRDVGDLLDYFYRSEYTGLTLNVAACEGNAGELINQQFPCGNSATDVIDKLLSSEAQASGNVSVATLKDIGEKLFSPSESFYMPFLKDGILGGGGESGGGEGSGGESGGGGSGGSGGQQCNESELTCNNCAVFTGGYCRGILSKEQTLALNLIFSKVKHVFVRNGDEENERVLGLRSCKGGVDVKIENGAPVLTFSFSAAAQIRDSVKDFSPKKIGDGWKDKNIYENGEENIAAMFTSLFEFARETDCDFLGLKTQIYKKDYSNFDRYAPTLYKDATVKCVVKIRPAG